MPGLHTAAFGQKPLAVPIAGLEKVELILKDQFMGNVIESQQLTKGSFSNFLDDLNAKAYVPKEVRMVPKYEFRFIYSDGRDLSLNTNGRYVCDGKTCFRSDLSLLTKYWGITRENYGKPMKPENKGKQQSSGIGF